MARIYRNELKYEVEPKDVLRLESRLEKVLGCDQHALNGGYLIRSLYFDNVYDRSLQENLIGADIRTKYRLRTYNHDPNYIMLEKKVKFVDRGYKDSLRLSYAEANALLHGHYAGLLDRTEALAQEFYTHARLQSLKPRLVVEYLRKAYVHPAGNVRVTLDTQIKTSEQVTSFFDPSLALRPERISKVLLEVKYDQFIPDIIQSVLAADTQRIAHSKYVIGRLAHL